MRRLRGALTVAAVALLLTPSLVRAQATAITGQIQGAIVDTSGAALPGVTVTGANAGTGFTRVATTDGEGRYQLPLMPIGTYTLTSELSGFARIERPNVVLSVGETVTINVEMRIATVQETVTVTTGSPIVETSRSLPGMKLNTLAIESLPINGRRFQDFMLMAPGAIVEGQRSGTSINGGRGINASYNIDGTSWDNPFFGGVKGGERSNEAYTISQEVISEFQVNNAGYSAEFGRSSGGLLNAITKSGTNRVTASGFWFYRDESFVSDDSFGRPPTDFRQHQFGATLGGPIIRNKTHFFTAYDQQVKSNPLIVEFTRPNETGAGIPGFQGKAGSVTQTNDIWTFFGRVDHELNPSNRLWARYNWSRNEGKNGLGSSPTAFAPEASGLEKDSTNTFVGSLNSVLGAKRMNELRFQFGREDRPREPNTTAVTITVTGLGTIGRSTFLPSLETDDRYQIADNFTWVSGRHSYRFGTDLNVLHIAQPFFLSRAGGEYRFRSVADYVSAVQTGAATWQDFRQGFGRTAVDFWQQNYAFYVQDTWTLTNALTVNYGLRYEAQFNPSPDTPNPALPQSSQIPDDKNNWAPRVGFSWDPWGDGRGAVRANAGIYYAGTPALLMVSPITTNGLVAYQLTLTPTSAGAPVFPNILSAAPAGAAIPRSDVNFFDPEFQNPRTLQVSAGVEREVFHELTFGVDFIYSDTKELERMFDANLAPASGTAADGRLLYQTPRPNTLFNRMLRQESSSKARYVGSVLSARRRWSGGNQWFNRGLQFQGHYAYGRAKDDDSNERNFSATFYQDWQNLASEYTWSDTDVRHNFAASATWRLSGDVQVGVIQSARSGRPYSLTSTSDLNFDGTFNQDRQYINGRDTGRNSFRHPNYFRTDLRVMKQFKLSTSAGEVSLDVFNVFNSANTFVGVTNRNFSNNVNAGVPNEQIGGSRQAQVSLRFRY
jgi:hypothetical protein